MAVACNTKEILREFIREVWSEGNVEAADKYIAQKYKLHHDPGDPWEGQELDLAGYKQRVSQLRAPFPDQYFDIKGIFAEDDSVVLTWLWSATHLGDIPDFPATGKQIAMSGVTAYFFDNGKICGHWQITDRLGVYQQLQKQKAAYSGQ